MPEILSQDEIDALLTTVAEDEKPKQRQYTAETEQGGVMVYDFRHPNRISKDQMRTLENIHDTFGGHLGSALSGVFRAVVETELMSVDQITYAEFIASLASPSCSYSFTISPMEGKCIIDFNPALAFGFVERMFGGTGKALETARELTGIERAIMSRVTTRVLGILKKGWARVLDVEMEVSGFESNPQFIQVVPPAETVIVVTLQVSILNTNGILTICYPYVTLDPIVPELSGQSWIDPSARQRSDADRLININNLAKVNVCLSSVLGEAEIPIRDYLNINIGDIITLDKPVSEPVAVTVEGEPKFTARPGRVGKKRGLEIGDIIEEFPAEKPAENPAIVDGVIEE